MFCSAGFLLLSVAFLIIERNIILILFLLTLYLLEHYELYKEEMRFHFLYQRLLHGPDDELDVKLVAASRLLHLRVLSLPSLPEI